MNPQRLRIAFCAALISTLWTNSSPADLIDFSDGTWNHGSGNVTGWQQPTLDTSPYSGLTNLSNGLDVTITVRDFGDVFHTNSNTANHMTPYQYPDNTAGDSLYLTQSSGSAYNSNNGDLENFLRIDIEFSAEAFTDFYVHDIDISDENWRDAVYVESFDSGFGNVGDGNRANYSAGDDIEFLTLHDQNLFSLVADNQTSGNPPSSSIGAADDLTDNSAYFTFNDSVRFVSVYYWNRDNDASDFDNQLIHLAGLRAFDAATIPEPGSYWLLSLCAIVGLQRIRSRKKLLSSSAA